MLNRDGWALIWPERFNPMNTHKWDVNNDAHITAACLCIHSGKIHLPRVRAGWWPHYSVHHVHIQRQEHKHIWWQWNPHKNVQNTGWKIRRASTWSKTEHYMHYKAGSFWSRVNIRLHQTVIVTLASYFLPSLYSVTLTLVALLWLSALWKPSKWEQCKQCI